MMQEAGTTKDEVVLYDGTIGEAAVLAVRGWLETFEKGVGTPSLNMNAAYPALVAKVANGRDIVAAGVMTFIHTPTEREIFIVQSFVEETFRGRGVYTMMWEALVAHAMTLGVVRIDSITHVRNAALRAAAARQGRTETGILIRYELDQG